MKKCSTNNNPVPNPSCPTGYYEKLNKKNERCCYKKPKSYISPPKSPPLSPPKSNSKGKKCSTNNNPTPPCPNNFQEKLNKKNEPCCYKKTEKSQNTVQKEKSQNLELEPFSKSVYTIENVPSDGDCLYHAFIYAMNYYYPNIPIPSTTHILRQELLKYTKDSTVQKRIEDGLNNPGSFSSWGENEELDL